MDPTAWGGDPPGYTVPFYLQPTPAVQQQQQQQQQQATAMSTPQAPTSQALNPPETPGMTVTQAAPAWFPGGQHADVAAAVAWQQQLAMAMPCPPQHSATPPPFLQHHAHTGSFAEFVPCEAFPSSGQSQQQQQQQWFFPEAAGAFASPAGHIFGAPVLHPAHPGPPPGIVPRQQSGSTSMGPPPDRVRAAPVPPQPPPSAAPLQSSMRMALVPSTFNSIRSLMLRQQSTYVQQLFELHKLSQVQKLLMCEMQIQASVEGDGAFTQQQQQPFQ